jgi:hypothetical protein
MKLISVLFLILLFTASTESQFKKYLVKGGAHYFLISPSGELKANYSSFWARGFIAFELGEYFDAEVGGGFMKWKQKDQINANEEDFEVDMIPIDLRIRLEPFGKYMKYANPYVYVGGGIVNHKLKKAPYRDTYVAPYDSTENEKWVGYFSVWGGA